MTDSERDLIYFENYWVAGRCESLHPITAVCHFDSCVNCGVSQSTKFIQSVVGAKEDGIFGAVTLGLVNKVGDISLAIITKREDFYYALTRKRPELKKFYKGWTNRLDALIVYIGKL